MAGRWKVDLLFDGHNSHISTPVERRTRRVARIKVANDRDYESSAS